MGEAENEVSADNMRGNLRLLSVAVEAAFSRVNTQCRFDVVVVSCVVNRAFSFSCTLEAARKQTQSNRCSKD